MASTAGLVAVGVLAAGTAAFAPFTPDTRPATVLATFEILGVEVVTLGETVSTTPGSTEIFGLTAVGVTVAGVVTAVGVVVATLLPVVLGVVLFPPPAPPEPPPSGREK